MREYSSNSRKPLRLFICGLLFVAIGVLAPMNSMSQKHETIYGEVVGFVNTPLRIAKLTNVSRTDIFFVRVSRGLNREIKGDASKLLIRVKFTYGSEAKDLVEKLVSGVGTWKFSLVKSEECSPIEEGSGTSIVKLKPETKVTKEMPCYDLLRARHKRSK
jgi:hypothetical protein